jgi:hypothetical protein
LGEKKYFSISQGYSGERCGPWTSCLIMLSDIHLIFDTLLCHIMLQIKFEFGFEPLIFHEVMALGLGNILQNVRFLHCCSPLTGFAVSDSYKSKLKFVMLVKFSTEFYRQ